MSDELEAAKRDLSALRIHRDPESRGGGARVAWIVIGVAILAGAVVGVRLYTRQAAVTTVETARVRVESGASGALFSAKGTILPDVKAEVASRIMGKIKALHVDEGSVVKRGDPLAELENDEVHAQVKEAEANRDRATQELARQEKLWKDKANMEKDVDDARTALRVADARLDYVKAQLEATIVRAPFDGKVVKRHGRVGEPIGPVGGGSSFGALVTLVDFSSLEMVAEVNESNFTHLDKVKAVEVTVDAVPGKVYRGSIRQRPTMADKAKGIVEVKVAIDDKDERLLPYMAGRATFLSDPAVKGAKHVVVPDEAVVDGFVFVVRDDAVHRVATAELQGGEEVVLRPSGLSDGQRIRRKE